MMQKIVEIFNVLHKAMIALRAPAMTSWKENNSLIFSFLMIHAGTNRINRVIFGKYHTVEISEIHFSQLRFFGQQVRYGSSTLDVPSVKNAQHFAERPLPTALMISVNCMKRKMF